MPKEIDIKYKVDTTGLDEAKRKLLELASIQMGGSGGYAGSGGVLGGPTPGMPGYGQASSGWGATHHSFYQQRNAMGQFGGYGQPGGGGGGPPPPPPGPGGMRGFGQFMAGGAMSQGGGFMRGLATFHGAQSILSGLNQTAQQYDPNYMNGAATAQRMGYNVANSLTFGLSGQAWSVGDRMGMGNNIQNRMEALQRSQGVTQSAFDMRIGMQGINNQRTSALYEVRRDQNDLRAAAEGSAAFVDRLKTPGLLESFNTNVPKIGVENELTGRMRLGVEQAGAGLNEARRAVASQRKLSNEAEAEAAKASEGVATARQMYASQRAKLSNAEGSEGTGAGKAGNVAEAGQGAKAANDPLQAALTNETEKRKQAHAALNDLREKENQLAEKQLQVDKAIANEKRNELSIAKENASVARGGSRQIGMSTIGEKNFLLRSAEKFKREGFDALNPMQKQALAGNAITAREVGRAAEESGSGMGQQLAALGFHGDMKKEDAIVGDKQKDVDMFEAKMDAGYKKQMLDIGETTGKKIAELIKGQFDSMMQSLMANMAGKELAKTTSNAIGGAG